MAFRRCNSLRKRSEFLRTQNARCARGRFAVVCVDAAGSEQLRFGVTASRKIGCAVVRNTCKRRLREAASMLLPNDLVANVVFIAKYNIVNATWNELIADLNNALRRVLEDAYP